MGASLFAFYNKANTYATVSVSVLADDPGVHACIHSWALLLPSLLRNRASSTTLTEWKFFKRPQWWARGCLRVGGNRLPLSRFSQREVAAVKANYTLDPQRTTINTKKQQHSSLTFYYL